MTAIAKPSHRNGAIIGVAVGGSRTSSTIICCAPQFPALDTNTDVLINSQPPMIARHASAA